MSPIIFSEHALTRIGERNATENEVRATLKTGKKLPAKFGRIKFQNDFIFNSKHKGKFYKTKRVIVITELQQNDLIVVSVLTKFIN